MYQSLNPLILDYITKNRAHKSRHDIDLTLLKEGYNPDEVEAVWQYFSTSADKREFSFKYLIVLVSKILGISSSLFGLIATIFIVYPLTKGGGGATNESGLGLIAFSSWISACLMGIIGGLTVTTNSRRARWLFITAAILGFFGSLGYLLMIVPSVGLIISAILLFAAISDKDEQPWRERELAELKEMVAKQEYAKALPRIYKLSRTNPDDPEVRKLIRICRFNLGEIKF